MMRRYPKHGAVASADEVAVTTRLLGRAPRSYRASVAKAGASQRR